jgi:hypothetical protein
MRDLKGSICRILISFLISASAFAQPTNQGLKKIPPALLRQDFLELRDTLQKMHPGLYRYRSKSAMDHIFDSCFATIRDSMSVAGFYALTSFVVAAMEDGHSNCRLSREAINDYIRDVKVFPAMVFFIHNKAFIFCCKQNDELAEAELLSIDGHPLDEIVQRLFCYIPSDGNIQSRKNWEMPESFQLLYSIVYGTKDSFNIVCRTKTGEVRTVVLMADRMKNFVCPAPFHRPDKYLELSYTSDNIAVLTLRSFFDGFLQQTNENFSRFLDSAFKDITEKKAEKLLIDMRSNQGGNDGNGIILYSYLTQKPFMYYASQETVTEKFTENGHPNLGLQQPKEHSFKGKVYFLINGRSFSGVAEFSAIASSNNRGIFIGEECGGGYYGNTSGDEQIVTLPNTQISCRIPLVKYTMAVKPAKYKDRGVLPDYPIYTKISDLVENTDGQLVYALKIAAKN